MGNDLREAVEVICFEVIVGRATEEVSELPADNCLSISGSLCEYAMLLWMRSHDTSGFDVKDLAVAWGSTLSAVRDCRDDEDFGS